MKYLVTSYENFGVFQEVNSLIGKYEVIGEKDVINFIQNHAPHLVSFDGQRAFSDRPEELAKFAHDLKNYELIFIPIVQQG
jgi:predicted PolB exonuclease-like 3'-5' exonuclease